MKDRPNIEENYMKERWENQFNWLDRKSTTYKKKYQRYKFAEIILAALIPFLAVLAENPIYQFLHLNLWVAVIGVGLTIIAGMLLLFKYHELWVQYRTTAEALKVEKFLYDTRSAPYDKDDAFHVFVAKVEAILANENSRWTELIQQDLKVKRDLQLEKVE